MNKQLMKEIKLHSAAMRLSLYFSDYNISTALALATQLMRDARTLEKAGCETIEEGLDRLKAIKESEEKENEVGE